MPFAAIIVTLNQFRAKILAFSFFVENFNKINNNMAIDNN